MSSNNDPKTIPIYVDGQIRNVYDNQSVLQALLQADESIRHCCHAARNYQENSRNYDCAVKIENVSYQNRHFQSCLAPAVAGMRILKK